MEKTEIAYKTIMILLHFFPMSKKQSVQMSVQLFLFIVASHKFYLESPYHLSQNWILLIEYIERSGLK